MRRRHLVSTLALALCATLWTTQGHAVLLAGWTFETSIPTTAGPHAAESGSGSALGLHASGSAVYSNPIGNGSAESFSSNFWAIGDYYQFSTSTVGYESISIAWDQTRSSTGPEFWDIQWSTDGSSFTALPAYSMPAPVIAWSSSLGTALSTFSRSGPTALDNQATIYFRMIATSAPGGTGGTSRVDNINIEGTAIPAAIPEPSTLLLVGLGGLLVCLRRLT